MSSKDLADELDFLCRQNLVNRHDEFYSLDDDPAHIGYRRKGNLLASKKIPQAKKAGAWLAAFPYVRAIGISGSLSKNFADERSDFDFFIITAKNRLWLARTFMHLFRKLAMLIGKHHMFCMNYYIDEEALEIREKNIFTAIELITLIPVRGHKEFQQLFAKNKWISDYFPTEPFVPGIIDPGRNPLKRLIEFIFNNRAGNWLEDRLMKVTHTRWRQKTKNKRRNSQGILLGMDAGKHYAKPDPNHLQSKILAAYTLKMEELEKINNKSMAAVR